MRAVVQRVKEASVSIDGKIVGQINKGLVILLGVKNVIQQTMQNFWQTNA